MLGANDIRNVKFSKSVGGYKQEEVDILLDKVEVDYEQHERNVRELQLKIDDLNKQIESYKTSQNSIQNVLLSAQRLADQIVEEAKVKSQEIINNAEASISIITAREKELSNAFELKASERKAAVEKEINAMIMKAQEKSEAIEAASKDSVSRQQVLFDKLKLEISAFKADVTRKYKEHLEILQKLPDAVPMDPKHMAEVVAAAVEKVPAAEEFTDISDDSTAEEVVHAEKEAVKNSGFVINNIMADEMEEAE